MPSGFARSGYAGLTAGQDDRPERLLNTKWNHVRVINGFSFNYSFIFFRSCKLGSECSTVDCDNVWYFLFKFFGNYLLINFVYCSELCFFFKGIHSNLQFLWIFSIIMFKFYLEYRFNSTFRWQDLYWMVVKWRMSLGRLPGTSTQDKLVTFLRYTTKLILPN